MTEEPLTFTELRKIQKKERRNNDLTDLDKNFILDAANYLQQKQELGENNREYNNAKRVVDKIISIREEKIFKQAKIAVKSQVNPENLNLLPREEKLFRKLRETFEEHREEIKTHLKQETTTGSAQAEEIEEFEEPEEEIEEPEKKEDEEKEEEIEEGYEKIKIISQVPEFMGTDLEPYGPFEEGETVKLPEENAEILVNRGNAEEL